MPYAFNLMLDLKAASSIERAYAKLAQLGVADHDIVTHYGPCVTILVIDDSLHHDDMKELLARQVRRTGEMIVNLFEPCIIVGTPPTLCLRVSPTAELLALHYLLFSNLAVQAVHLHYRPAYWQPHLKLANIRPDTAYQEKLLFALAAYWTPMPVTLRAIEVIHYPPTETVWQAPLQSGAMPSSSRP